MTLYDYKPYEETIVPTRERMIDEGKAEVLRELLVEEIDGGEETIPQLEKRTTGTSVKRIARIVDHFDWFEHSTIEVGHRDVPAAQITEAGREAHENDEEQFGWDDPGDADGQEVFARGDD